MHFIIEVVVTDRFHCIMLPFVVYLYNTQLDLKHAWVIMLHGMHIVPNRFTVAWWSSNCVLHKQTMRELSMKMCIQLEQGRLLLSLINLNRSMDK